MFVNNYSTRASIYAKHSLNGTGFLAFKYVPEMIKKYTAGRRVLDYGCGSGRSTRFLKDLKLDVIGVDISHHMIKEAITQDNIASYKVIESAEIPYDDETFDLVFSSLVLFEIPKKNELLKVFNEAHRVIKLNGVFIAVTGSMEMYNHPWLSLDANYPENKNLKSGSLAKILLKEIDLILFDYYWTDDDYKEIISHSKFDIVEQRYPLGEDNDGIEWISEKKSFSLCNLRIKKVRSNH